MIEKLRPYQILVIILGSIISTGHLLFVPMVIEQAGKDAWISLAIGSLILLVQILLLFVLSKRFPNESIHSYAPKILGRFFGKAVSVTLMLYFLTILIMVIRMLGEIIVLTLLPYTPVWVISGLIILLGSYAVTQGIEVIGRTVEFIIHILFLLGIIASIVSAPNRELVNMLPMFDHHFGEILFGGLLLAGLFSQSIVYLVLLQHSNNFAKSKRLAFLGVAILFISFVGPITGPVNIFGEKVASILVAPTYTELTFASVSKYLERLSPVGIILWTMGSYIKITCFYYAFTKSLKEIIKKPQWEKLIICFTALLLIGSLYFEFSIFDFEDFWKSSFWLISLLVGIGIPGFLWLGASIRGVKSNN